MSMIRRTMQLVVGLPVVALLALTTACSEDQLAPSVGTRDAHPTAAAPVEAPRQTREGYLAELATSLRIEDPPVVEVVRELEPEEVSEVVQECLGAAGFPTGADGAISHPEDQQETFYLAYYTCHAQFPVKEIYLQPLTDEQRLFIRSHWIDSVIPCLAELGYELPQPPSAQAYLDSLGTAEEYTISGELVEFGIPYSAIETALRECPENPPSAAVYAN